MLLQTVSSVEWHRKGDYLSTVMLADILFPMSLLLHFFFFMQQLMFYMVVIVKRAIWGCLLNNTHSFWLCLCCCWSWFNPSFVKILQLHIRVIFAPSKLLYLPCLFLPCGRAEWYEYITHLVIFMGFLNLLITRIKSNSHTPAL